MYAYVSAFYFLSLFVSASLSAIFILSASVSASVSASEYFPMSDTDADKVRHGCLQTFMSVSAEICAEVYFWSRKVFEGVHSHVLVFISNLDQNRIFETSSSRENELRFELLKSGPKLHFDT